MKAKFLVTAIISLLLFTLGFFREFVFESINIQLGNLYNQTGWTYLPGPLILFEGFTYKELYYSKFALTFVFSAAFWSLTALGIHQFFRNRQRTILTSLIFLIIFGLSFGSFVLGKLLGFEYKAYALSRFLADFIQSPLTLFILIPGFLLADQKPEN